MRRGMSPNALARCRRMKITLDNTGGYSALIQIEDPGQGGKVCATYKCRLPSDTERVQRNWVAKYKIPPENVTVVDLAKQREEEAPANKPPTVVILDPVEETVPLSVGEEILE